MIKIAVLITSHNRHETTLRCLKSLHKQDLCDQVKLEVYLVDDGSTDGTGEMIKRRFPDVNVLNGNGNLFWGGGMRYAWKEALNKEFDYFVWLNDDTILHEFAVRVMLTTEKKIKTSEGTINSIIVGSICDPSSNEHTYGGLNQYVSLLSVGFKHVIPSDKPIQCDTFNGNLILIPKRVFGKIGELNKSFTHSMGDIDYGLRASERGIANWIAPGYLGTCSRNPEENTWKDPDISFIQRKRMQNSPKGLPQAEWKEFLKTHYGFMWIIGYIKLRLRVTFPRTYRYLKKMFAGKYTNY